MRLKNILILKYKKMPYIISIFSLLIIFLIRKSFSQYYFSPTGFFTTTWITFLTLKLFIAPEYYFSIEASLYFVFFIFSFLVGELFMVLYLTTFTKSVLSKSIINFDFSKQIEILSNPLKIKLFENIILVFGILSLIGSVLYVSLFISYFGSINNLLSAGWAVRGVLEEISIPIFIRVILLIAYSSIILTLTFFIIHHKYKFHFIFSYISILIMGITQAGRAGFMMVLFQVFIATYWRVLFENISNDKKRYSFFSSPEYKLIISSFRLIFSVGFIFIAGDMLRAQNFSFDTAILLQGIISFKSYLFGGIAGFTTYLNGYDSNDLGWGRFTFSSLYDMLGIHKNELGIYTDYLRISSLDANLDTNIFTAFRQLMDDFGFFGTFVFMFFSGVVSNYFFMKAVKGDISSIGFLIVFYTFIFHSPLLAISVHTSVLISIIIPFFIIKFLYKTIKII
jgi:oligosaccharide repeat unit polymerase